MICFEERTLTDLGATQEKVDQVTRSIKTAGQVFLTLFGLIVIFAWRLRSTKPRFVKLIWIFLTLAALLSIAELYLVLQGVKEKDDDAIFDAVRCGFVSSFLISTVYWLFAIEYFSVVLKFPLMMNQ